MSDWRLPVYVTGDHQPLTSSNRVTLSEYRFETFAWVTNHARACVPRLREPDPRIGSWSAIPLKVIGDFAHKICKWHDFSCDLVLRPESDGWSICEDYSVLLSSVLIVIAQVFADHKEVVGFLTARLQQEPEPFWVLENDAFDPIRCGSTLLYESVYAFFYSCHCPRLLLEFDATNVRAKEIIHVSLCPAHAPAVKWSLHCNRGKKSSFYKIESALWNVGSLPLPPNQCPAAKQFTEQPLFVEIKQLSQKKLSTKKRKKQSAPDSPKKQKVEPEVIVHTRFRLVDLCYACRKCPNLIACLKQITSDISKQEGITPRESLHNALYTVKNLKNRKKIVAISQETSAQWDKHNKEKLLEVLKLQDEVLLFHTVSQFKTYLEEKQNLRQKFDQHCIVLEKGIWVYVGVHMDVRSVSCIHTLFILLSLTQIHS